MPPVNELVRNATVQRIATEMQVGQDAVQKAIRELRPRGAFINGDFLPLDVRRIRRHISLQRPLEQFAARFQPADGYDQRLHLHGVALSLEEASEIIGVDSAVVAPEWEHFASHTDEDLLLYSRDPRRQGYKISLNELCVFLGLSKDRTRRVCHQLGVRADPIPVTTAEKVRQHVKARGLRPGLRIRRVFSRFEGGMSAALLPALVDLSLKCDLEANVRMAKRESNWIIARSDRLLERLGLHFDTERRTRLVRVSAVLYEEALALQLDAACLSQLEQNHFRLRSIRRANDEVMAVIERVLAGETHVAAELLGPIVAPDNPPLPENPALHRLIERIRSARGQASSITRTGLRTWWLELSGEGARNESGESANERHREEQERAAEVEAWIEADPGRMSDAKWPAAQQQRAGEFLAAGTTGWLPRGSEVEFKALPQTLSQLEIAIYEILPRAEGRKLVGQPIAIIAEGTRIVSWVRPANVYSWVGFSEGAVAVNLDLRRFAFEPEKRSNATLVASTLAAAWFLDALLLTTGSHSPRYTSTATGPWVQVPGGFSKHEVRASQLLRQFDVHHVRQHLRTLPPGQQPSEEAIARAPDFLRRQMRPEQTYVRASLRGSERLFHDMRKFASVGSFLADVILASRRA